MGHESRTPTRVLIVGGGYVGMYTALGLKSLVRRGEATVTVVDPQSHMTYQPFLPEAAAGSVEPRHVVVPLRKVLKGCRIVTGRVSRIEHAQRRATVDCCAGNPEVLEYDVLVVAPGSVARTLPIPGLAEHGISFKTIGEAIYLRNHVLSQLDAAATCTEPVRRQRLLTFLVIGGGYAGIEALAELEDMARYAVKHYYDEISPDDLRWVLVEATSRIMPEVSPKMGVYTVERLMERDIEVYLDTRVKTMEGGHVVLDESTEFDAETIVWTAGVKANPMLRQTDLPLDDKGRIRCNANLSVVDTPGVFSAGDCAAVPDLSKRDDPNATTSPSAQHAVRQAKVLARNVKALIRGKELKDYEHSYAGSVASLGLYRGVAEVYGVKIKGLPAWFMHRTYHVSRMPTFNRKVRIVADWTGALLFRREIVALGQVNDPHAEFVRATSSQN